MSDGGIQANISYVWVALTVMLSLGIGLQCGTIFAFRSEAPKYNIQINPFSDLYVMGVSLCLISLFRWSASVIVKPAIEERLQLVDPNWCNSKVNKNTRAYVSCLWYIFSTVSILLPRYMEELFSMITNTYPLCFQELVPVQIQ